MTFQRQKKFDSEKVDKLALFCELPQKIPEMIRIMI